MLRSKRSVAALLGNLLLAPTAVAAIGTAAFVVGCQDETQPEYWVGKLSEPSFQSRSVKRLEQFFNSAHSKANGNLADPKVKELVEKTVKPLTDFYVQNFDLIEQKTRESTLRLLADYRDARGEAAFKKALDEFATRPREKDFEDLKWAAKAQSELKLPALQAPAFAAFLGFKRDSLTGEAAHRELLEALRAMPDAAWAGPLRQRLNDEFPDSELVAKDRQALAEARNVQFQQGTAVDLLGALRDEASVQPIFKILLDPNKATIHASAALALTDIGKAVLPLAGETLKGENTALVEFAKKQTQKALKSAEAPTDEPYVKVAAVVIGTVGRSEGLPLLLEALEKTSLDDNRAVIAGEIAKIPATNESKRAFQKAFEQLGKEPDNAAPNLTTLAEAATSFRDSSFVPWLLERLEKTTLPKTEDIQVFFRAAMLHSAIKLMEPGQTELVRKSVEKYAPRILELTKESTKGRDTVDVQKAFGQAATVLTDCTDRVPCYIAKLQTPEAQGRDAQFASIKAAYMTGVFGDESVPAQLLKDLDKVENAAVRHVLALNIDVLSPKGSIDAADTIRAMVEARKETADRSKTDADGTLRQVMHRLRTRAN